MNAGQPTQDRLHFARTLGRGLTLFREIMPHFDRSFEGAFLKSAGMTLEDYFCCLSTTLITRFGPREGPSWLQAATFGSQTVCPELVQQFLRLESQTPEELREKLTERKGLNATPDLKPMRERPLLLLGDGSARFIDPSLTFDRASKGPLFLVARHATSANTLFAHFGCAFERYVHQLFERMYPASTHLAKRAENDLHTTIDGHQVQVDACVRGGDTLLLFEIKARFLRDDVLMPVAMRN